MTTHKAVDPVRVNTDWCVNAGAGRQQGHHPGTCPVVVVPATDVYGRKVHHSTLDLRSPECDDAALAPHDLASQIERENAERSNVVDHGPVLGPGAKFYKLNPR